MSSRASSIPTPMPPRWCITPISSCPTRPISNAGIAFRCSTGRFPKPMAPPIPSASPWSSRSATCAPFRSVLLDLGARLGLPGMTRPDGTARYPGGYPDYMVNHERAPGLGPLAGWRGKDGKAKGRGAPNPDQLKAYIDNGCHWFYELPDHMKYYRHANWDYLGLVHLHGLHGKARADHPPALLRTPAEISPRRARPWKNPAARRPRQAHLNLFRSRALLVSALRRRHGFRHGISHARHHPAPHGHVSFLGLAECLAPPNPRAQLALHEQGPRRHPSALPKATG